MPRKRPVVGATRRMHSSAQVLRESAAAQALYRSGPGLVIRWPPIEWRVNRARVLALALVILLAVALYQMGNNDAFFVSSLDITGNENIPASDIERAADITYWNVFFVDPRAVESAVERLPEVESVHVRTGLPNLVAIDIQERKPDLIWQTGSNQFWVGSDGTALPVRNSEQLPIIVDADVRAVEIGQKVNQEAVNAVRALRDAWPDAPLKYEWSSNHGLTIVEAHGWRVFFGSGVQMSEKVQALQAVTSAVLQANLRLDFIDLANGLPYIRETRKIDGK